MHQLTRTLNNFKRYGQLFKHLFIHNNSFLLIIIVSCEILEAVPHTGRINNGPRWGFKSRGPQAGRVLVGRGSMSITSVQIRPCLCSVQVLEKVADTMIRVQIKKSVIASKLHVRIENSLRLEKIAILPTVRLYNVFCLTNCLQSLSSERKGSLRVIRY